MDLQPFLPESPYDLIGILIGLWQVYLAKLALQDFFKKAANLPKSNFAAASQKNF